MAFNYNAIIEYGSTSYLDNQGVILAYHFRSDAASKWLDIANYHQPLLVHDHLSELPSGRFNKSRNLSV